VAIAHVDGIFHGFLDVAGKRLQGTKDGTKTLDKGNKTDVFGNP
jgi:hypothetical protein